MSSFGRPQAVAAKRSPALAVPVAVHTSTKRGRERRKAVAAARSPSMAVGPLIYQTRERTALRNLEATEPRPSCPYSLPLCPGCNGRLVGSEEYRSRWEPPRAVELAEDC